MLVPDLAAEEARWPEFVAAARAAGCVSVHALPMRLRDTVLGTLGLFGASPGALNAEDLALGQALAHVATVALVAERATADGRALTGQLQAALTSRVTLEQAKGILAQLGDLDMDRAFTALSLRPRSQPATCRPCRAGGQPGAGGGDGAHPRRHRYDAGELTAGSAVLGQSGRRSLAKDLCRIRERAAGV